MKSKNITRNRLRLGHTAAAAAKHAIAPALLFRAEIHPIAQVLRREWWVAVCSALLVFKEAQPHLVVGLLSAEITRDYAPPESCHLVYCQNRKLLASW